MESTVSSSSLCVEEQNWSRSWTLAQKMSTVKSMASYQYKTRNIYNGSEVENT
jgi:hypothetical protein